VIRPDEETLEDYRAAVLACRQAFKAGREKHRSLEINPIFRSERQPKRF
jgi:hypothetical protein